MGGLLINNLFLVSLSQNNCIKMMNHIRYNTIAYLLLQTLMKETSKHLDTALYSPLHHTVIDGGVLESSKIIAVI